MSYLGRWTIDALLTFAANTHDVATGAATDADSVPSYRVYEDETGTAILTGSMAKLDDTNTTGFYSEQLTLSAANGFEVGKSYTVYISATVDSVVGTMHHSFQVEEELASISELNAEIDTALSDVGLTTTVTGRIDAAISTRSTVTTAQVNAEVDAALADYDPPTKAELDSAVAPLATQSSVNDLPTNAELATALGTADDAVLSAIAGLNDPTAAEIADAVWLEGIADHSGTTGSTAEALGAAGAAGDPWTTTLPGAYGAGSAGKIIGDNINATISSRASQTSVDDLPTNAELTTALASADDATLAAIAALNNLSAAQVNAEVDTAISDASLATAANLATVAAYLDTEIAAILADTNELQTDWANGGRLDLLVDTLISNVASILADTGTDGIVISQTTRQAIADEVLGRSVANVESTATVYTIAGLVLAAFESAIAGTDWTINRTDGSTQFATRTVTVDDTADPITGVS
jgi:hypothetical protein